jgi:hypothetical protein
MNRKKSVIKQWIIEIVLSNNLKTLNNMLEIKVQVLGHQIVMMMVILYNLLESGLVEKFKLMFKR